MSSRFTGDAGEPHGEPRLDDVKFCGASGFGEEVTFLCGICKPKDGSLRELLLLLLPFPSPVPATRDSIDPKGDEGSRKDPIPAPLLPFPVAFKAPPPLLG